MMQPAELHRRCLRGDDAAWAQLAVLVHKFVAANVRNPRIDVDDLSQEILLWLHRDKRLAKAKNPDALRSFLWRVVRHKALELLEAKWTKAEHPVGTQPDDSADDALERRAVAQALLAMPVDKQLVHHQALRRAWNGLDETDRKVLRLYESYKKGEIDYAEMLAEAGVKARGTLAARNNRAGERLLARVKELGITM